MKKLPKIYHNDNIKTINNNKEIVHLKNIEEKKEELNIEKELKDIFYGIGHSFNTKVIIETKDKKVETYLIAKDKENVVTIENETIPIKDIIYLKIKN